MTTIYVNWTDNLGNTMTDENLTPIVFGNSGGVIGRMYFAKKPETRFTGEKPVTSFVARLPKTRSTEK